MSTLSLALMLSLSKHEGVARTVGTWAYMLRCSDGRFYVGSFRGDDLNWRVVQHNEGVHPQAWTYKRRPVALVWSEHFDLFIDAFTTERRIKGWSHAKKEALIKGDYEEISRLRRSKSPRPSAFNQRLAAGPLKDDDQR